MGKVGKPAASKPVSRVVLSRLTPAEREMLVYVRDGLNVPSMAAALGRPAGTVSNQFTALARKLGSRTRGRLIALLNQSRAVAKYLPTPNTNKPQIQMIPLEAPPEIQLPPRRVSKKRPRRAEPLANPWEVLTPAEMRVAEQVMQGLSNKEIAVAVGRSNATVKNQIRSMFHKAGYRKRGRIAVALLRHRHLVEMPPAEQKTEVQAPAMEREERAGG